MRVHSIDCNRSGFWQSRYSSHCLTTPSTPTGSDELRRPIDQEVFMRMWSYYEVRPETERPSGAPAKMNAAQPAAAAHRRMQ